MSYRFFGSVSVQRNLTVGQDATVTGTLTVNGTALVPTVTATDSSTNAASTAFVNNYVTAQNYVTGNQNITISGDASGSGTTAITITLPTINSNTTAVGSATVVPVITANAKGQVTSISTATISIPSTAVSGLGTMAAQSANGVNITGGTITGMSVATNPTDVVILSQVNTLLATGPHDYRQATAIFSSNVSITSPGAMTDGSYSVTNGKTILLIGQLTGSQNGPWVYNGASSALTRPTDYAAASSQTDKLVYSIVGSGSTKQNWQYICNTTPVTVDTTATTWGIFQPQISASTPLSISGGVISIQDPIPNSYGGTGTDTVFPGGSIVFAATDGSYTQDNANLFWDATNARLGVGTITPGYSFDTTGSIRGSTLISTVATGTAPLTVASTTKVVNLNADQLDGNDSTYFAPIASPNFSGTVTAPTPTAGDSSTKVATTAFLSAYALLNSPTFTGSPTAPTVTATDSSTKLATTSFVNNYVTSQSFLTGNQSISVTGDASGSGTTSIAVTLKTVNSNTTAVGSSSVVPVITANAKGLVTSISSATITPVAIGAAPINSPALTGVPTAPTVTATDNSDAIATTAFVANLGLLPSATAATTYAPINSPSLTGSPTAPTQSTADSSTAIATTAFVDSYTTSALTPYAKLASPTFTGVVQAPTVTSTDNSTSVATSAFVKSLGYLTGNQTVSLTGDASGSGTTSIAVTLPTVNSTTTAVGSSSVVPVITANGKGLVTSITTATITPAAIGAAPLSSPGLTGVPTAPTVTSTDSSTSLATTAFVHAYGTAGSGSGLNADLLDGQHGPYYAPVNSPNLTGTPTAPTVTVTDNSTSIATTAFVQGFVNNAVTSALSYKGTRDVTTLAPPASPATGAMYRVTVTGAPYTGWVFSTTVTTVDAGDFVVYNGTDWDRLAETNPNVVSGTNITVSPTGDYTYSVALASSPALAGTPTAPTPTAGDSSTQIATTAFITTSFAPRVSPTFTGNPKAPTVTVTDNSTSIATSAYVQAVVGSYAPLSSPALTGSPTAPTVTATDSSTKLATTAFVGNYVTSLSLLSTGTAASTYAPLASPTFTGTVIAPTVTSTDNSTKVATTAFVNAYVSGSYAPIASPTFTGLPKAPTVTSTDNSTSLATTAWVKGLNLAPIASPAFTGNPTAPTVTSTDNSTNIATTAFIASLGLLPSATATTTYAPIASPALTGVPTAPTPSTTDNSTKIATTAFVVNQAYLTASSAASTYAPLVSPSFSGTPTAPTPTSTDSSTKLATTAWVSGKGFLTGNQSISLTGDATGSGTTSIAVTLPTVNSNTATYGSTSVVPVITANGKGLVTSITTATITPAAIGAAPLNSPNLTGTPTSVTPTAGDSSTNIATTAFVASSVSSRYTATFTTGSWAGTGPYTLSYTAATHGRGANPIISIYSGASSPFSLVLPDSTTIDSSGNITISVPTVGLTFAGKIVVL